MTGTVFLAVRGARIEQTGQEEHRVFGSSLAEVQNTRRDIAGTKVRTTRLFYSEESVLNADETGGHSNRVVL